MSGNASLAKELLKAAWSASDASGAATAAQARLPNGTVVYVGAEPAFVAPGRGAAIWYEPLPHASPSALRYYSPIALPVGFVTAVLKRLGAETSAVYPFDIFGMRGERFHVFRNDGAAHIVVPSLPPTWGEKEVRHLLTLDEWVLNATGLAYV